MAKKTQPNTTGETKATKPLVGKLDKKDPIQAIAEMVADGYKDSAIAKALTARGIPPMEGNRAWYATKIGKLRKRGLIPATRDKALPVRPNAIMWACVCRQPGIWECRMHAADEGRAFDSALNAVREATAAGALKAVVVPDAQLARFMHIHASDIFEVCGGTPAVPAAKQA